MVRSAAKAVGRRVAEVLPPVASAVESALNEIAGVKVNSSLEGEEVEATVKGAVREAVAEAVEKVVNHSAEEGQTATHK